MASCLGSLKYYSNLKKTVEVLQRSYSNVSKTFYYHPTFEDNEEQAKLENSFRVLYNFISEEEEKRLEEEVEPILKRLRYEANHWDAAILGYRETEKKDWGPENARVLQRVKQVAFTDGAAMPLVHVLDLKAEGVIKPHVDSVKFCGSTITGLSLLTDAVMRLAGEQHPERVADVLLPRRSLYIMTGVSRYDYTHAVLGGDDSVFQGVLVKKARRISIICRNEPTL